MTILFSVLVLIAVFFVLAVLTEEFFVPSIDKIAKRLKMSSDASGAILLAAGSSAPEFFIALFAAFGVAGAAADIGAGTIVGSAIFNVLVIVGAAAMFKSVTLQWQPVIRDQLFYILTILLLLWAFWDGQIVLYEAITFVALYVVYVIAVLKWRKLFPYKDTPAPEITDKKRSGVSKVIYTAIKIVVPDPATSPRLSGMTFILSILVIAGLSWVLVEEVIRIASAMAINPTFLALTVIAAGTSVPDLIGSITVARQGRGDMAVSNAIGSNIFDVLFALGVPFLIIIGINGGEPVPISRENLLASIFLLLATVVAILFILVMRKWRIGSRSGIFLLLLYAAYCVYVFINL